MSRRQLRAPAVIVVLLGALWWGSSAYTAGRVTVTWAGSPVCSGTTVKPAESIAELNDDDDGDGIEWVELVVARPAMRCTIEVVVRNAGPLGVRVRDLVAPLVGPDGGGVVMGVGGRVPDTEGGETDLQYDVSRVVDRGESIKLPIVVRYRDDGCSEGWAAIPQWPVAQVSVLGLRYSVASTRSLEYEHLEQNPGCDLVE